MCCPLRNCASLIGVYGVSALVAGASTGLAAVLMRAPIEREATCRWPIAPAGTAPLLGVLALSAVIAAWGHFRIARGDLTRAGEQVRVGLVQGNVDQAEKWDPARAAAIFQSYLSMTRQAIDGGATMVLWPESSTPFHFAEQPAQAARVRALAREAKVPILIGSDEIERGAPTRVRTTRRSCGRTERRSASTERCTCVPFGEYVPFKRMLFFAAPLVEAAGDFSAGESAVLLPVERALW